MFPQEGKSLVSLGDLVLDVIGKFCIGQIIAIWLKTRIPAECLRSSWTYDGPSSLSLKKNNWLTWSIWVGKNADCNSGFVIESTKHFEETIRSYAVEEPFDVWSWHTLHSIEVEATVFDYDWSLNNFSCPFAFIGANFFRGTLEFRKVNIEISYLGWKTIAKDGNKFFQFLGIASDKNQWFDHFLIKSSKNENKK